ncbi:N-ethylmaleimide reductase [Saccharopolyspora kobensis]|uniref:N-ethylmaleimide reductase n=1 Tax=Saccharopolyspora kobensis TaxID=146035 RepID=A0A1H5W2E2_9PSEU|nr:alkene reductase [Saccharopolyspora kobensis]SEF93704.1 N-ethylmaleimide reductase [Saccharopolyspora kobensis]SFD71783.1 N-ethylmaleimide reductase [Saccharopolyspora kobensis]
MTTAFSPFQLGDVTLRNRIVMAPMTRTRAGATDGTPTELMAEYYAQRASAGLIITEGVQPSVVGQGYPFTPGLHTQEQVAAWRKVTDRVHAAGGRIFAQLMHTGRIGHPSLLPDGLIPVGASVVAAQTRVFTPSGPQDCVTPKELSEAEILDTIDDFANAARNAIEAGFDGVELHGANGYLLHQFLAPSSNRRTDAWGGSLAGRRRLVVETVRAVADAVGGQRTALRISPGNPFNDISEDDLENTYGALVEAINPFGLAYLHIAETADRALTKLLRSAFDGTFVLNPNTPGRPTGVEELELLEDGTADLLSYGVLFLANPDLPARLADGGPFNTPDPDTFYGRDSVGYTDYPSKS